MARAPGQSEDAGFDVWSRSVADLARRPTPIVTVSGATAERYLELAITAEPIPLQRGVPFSSRWLSQRSSIAFEMDG